MGVEAEEISATTYNLNGGSNINVSGFFNHVFNFDNENKSILFNAIQYLLMAIIPVVIVLKLIKIYIPEDDNDKKTPEIVFEILLQLVIIVFFIYILDKIIRYFPTFSKMPYMDMNIINIILPTLFIMLTMQTKLGAKINILVDRINSKLFGHTTSNTNNNKYVGKTNMANPNSNNKVIISDQHQPSRADQIDSNMIAPPTGQLNNQRSVSLIDNLPNFVNNQQQNNIPDGVMQNVFTDNEPLAANDLLGGGSMF